MEYKRDVMTFENGPIIKVSGATDFSIHPPLFPVEKYHIDFECAKCGYPDTDLPIEYDKENESWWFNCPGCDLRYAGSTEGNKMNIHTRWMEYNPPIKE